VHDQSRRRHARECDPQLTRKRSRNWYVV
jgi:hypothetical protein